MIAYHVSAIWNLPEDNCEKKIKHWNETFFILIPIVLEFQSKTKCFKGTNITQKKVYNIISILLWQHVRSY